MRKILEKYYGYRVYIVAYPKISNNQPEWTPLSPCWLIDGDQCYYIDHLWSKVDRLPKGNNGGIYTGLVFSYTHRDGKADYGINNLTYIGENRYKFLSYYTDDATITNENMIWYHAKKPTHRKRIPDEETLQQNKSIIDMFEGRK